MSADVDCPIIGARYLNKHGLPFLDRLLTVDGGLTGSQRDFIKQLEQMSPAARLNLIIEQVRLDVAKILDFAPADGLDTRRGFFKMGMDSLMTMQLRVQLESGFGRSLPPTVAFEYPTIESLAGYIANHFFAEAASSEQPVPAVNEATSDLDDLSESELLALLDNELASLNKLTGGN
jgi:myxalamid-type polyketide synthase MxaE and MxaD